MATMKAAEPPVPPFVMDRPILHAFVRELVEHERLIAFAEALPAHARVSEPALPLLLAALHERLQRQLVAVLPEDADARDAAEAAAWFLGQERIALLPSRGVRWDSGLEPPPFRAWSRPRSKSPSSWTTSTDSGSTLKKRAAALTGPPEAFMYVSGLSSATLWPSIRISASRPENLPFHEPPCLRASSSRIIQPTLCRFFAYSRPGLPSPTTSKSSDDPESALRRKRRKG